MQRLTVSRYGAISAGLGQHVVNLDRQQQQDVLFWSAPLTEPFAVLSPTFARCSFSILAGTGSKKRWAIKGVIAVQLVANGITVIQIWAQCGKHIAALWDLDVAAHASCQKPEVQTVIAFVQSSFNSLCDVALTVMPVLVLWNLQMPLRSKLRLGVMFALSLVALAFSIIKSVFLCPKRSSETD